jgi:hypothetical protein
LNYTFTYEGGKIICAGKKGCMYTMGFLMHLLIDTVQGAVLGARDTRDIIPAWWRGPAELQARKMRTQVEESSRK